MTAAAAGLGLTRWLQELERAVAPYEAACVKELSRWLTETMGVSVPVEEAATKTITALRQDWMEDIVAQLDSLADAKAKQLIAEKKASAESMHATGVQVDFVAPLPPNWALTAAEKIWEGSPSVHKSISRPVSGAALFEKPVARSASAPAPAGRAHFVIWADQLSKLVTESVVTGVTKALESTRPTGDVEVVYDAAGRVSGIHRRPADPEKVAKAARLAAINAEFRGEK